MCKLRDFILNLLPGVFLTLAVAMTAQEERLARAQQLYRSKNYDMAALVIDSVIAHPQTKNDFVSWTYRAFIYYELFKKTDKLKLNSPLRDTVVTSIVISNKLNPDSEIRVQNNRVLVVMYSICFNLAKKLLDDSLNYERSAQAFDKFKEIYRLYDPTVDLTEKEVDYLLAVGSTYSDIFIKDNSKTKAGETAKLALMKVMELQPDNPHANINMGLMFYNQSVNLSKSLDYGADFSQIDFVQDNMVKLAHQSEQFIVKVYNKDNKNLKAVEALYYIYRMLNDNAKSDEFKKKGEELGIKFDQQDPAKEGENKQQNKDK
jgi:hypothetical protein